jgi:regulator of sigma E protease
MSGLIDAAEAIVLFVLVLGILVLFHELGHFVTARLARVRVVEFGFGFPPRAKVLHERPVDPGILASWERKQTTLLEQAGGDPEQIARIEAMPRPAGMQYTLNWLPIGGFVKLEGEDGDQLDDPRSFGRAPLWKKVLILLMGVVMNLVLSVVIFGGIAWLGAPQIGIKFDAVDPGSPAAAAGLVVGDTIASIDGKQYDFYNGIYGDGNILDHIRLDAGKTVQLGVIHADGSTATLTVTLRSQSAVDAGKGALGIRSGADGFVPVILPETTGRPLGEAASIGWQETGRWFNAIFDALGALGNSIVNHPTEAPPVSGPVGIAGQLSQTFRDQGPIMTLYVAGILSANLALVNVLPFPPLDGGRILVLVLKAIPRVGRRISQRAEQATYAIGFLALFGFLIWVTFFDIARGITGGG